MARRQFWFDLDAQSRNLGLHFRGKVDDALNLRHCGLHLSRQAAQCREIVAKDLGDVRPGAGQHVIDAMQMGWPRYVRAGQ